MTRLLPYLIFYFYRFLLATWRIKISEHPETAKLLSQKSPLILAHWHGDEYSLFHLVTRYRLTTITSSSKDGDIVDFVIRKLGGETSRGSSTRGGVTGLRGLVRFIKQGRISSVAVDGPRGPIYQPKPGAFELSKLCQASIVAVGVVAAPRFVFKKSWNKAYLPLPFAEIKIYLSDPMPPIDRSEDAKNPILAASLTARLNAARQQASKVIASTLA